MHHHFLTLSDEEKYDYVFAALKRNNPTICFGERLRGPSDIVWQGRLIDLKPELPDGAVSITFDQTPKHVPVLCESVTVKSHKIMVKDLNSCVMKDKEGHYLYPWGVMMPHEKWLVEQNPGDKVWVQDSEFAPMEITLTDKMFDDHMYVIARFAISDK